MANNKNVVVIYDKLQSAVKKLEQYYTKPEIAQYCVSLIDLSYIIFA